MRLSRDQNRDLNLREYAAGSSTLRSLPRFVLVELTRGCNLACQMCRPQVVPTKATSMSRERFAEIADQLFMTAEMVDLRGWGESLILSNIEEIIRTTARYGPAIRFVTNLSFRRDEILKCLAEFGCHVAVSVDTADPQLFALLRRGARLSQIEKNLSRLVTFYREHGLSADLLHLICTVQRPAVDHLGQVAELAARLGIPEVRFFEATVPAESHLSLAGAARELDNALVTASERARASGVRLFAGTRLGSARESSPGGPACIHPWAYATVAYDGQVGFCDHLIGSDGDPYLLGSLDRMSFEEIWNGPEWQELRREHVTARRALADRFRECAWCYRNRYVDFEYLFDPAAEGRRVTIEHLACAARAAKDGKHER